MGLSLEAAVCANPSCAHPLAQHGADGFCYGVCKHRTGYFINCVCKKFRFPQPAPQTPPQML